METEAQKKAKRKYTKEKVKKIVLQFYPKDKKLYDFAKNEGAKIGSVNKFLHNLIQEKIGSD